MSKELDNRRMTLVVQTQTSSKKWTSGQAWDLDFSFQVEKGAGSDPNSAKIQVWNLNPESRRAISDGGVSVQLSAGYVGTEGLIFSGDVDEATTTRDGADLVTQISCSDGGQAIRSTVVNISTAQDSPVSSVIDELLDTLGLSKGSLASVTGALKQGITSITPAKKLLDEICASSGLQWSVQDGTIQTHKIGEGTSGTVVVLSVESGMVGIPVRMVERDQQGNVTRTGVQVRSLLQPGLNPGRRIRVKSDWVSGDFVVERITHTGSTFGGEWYTDVEAF